MRKKNRRSYKENGKDKRKDRYKDKGKNKDKGKINSAYKDRRRSFRNYKTQNPREK